MPSPVYDLTVLAPDHSLFQGRVRSLIAPGAEGYFGILARHAPLVAQLGTGVLSVTGENGEASLFAVHSGFLEVEPDGVTILADTAEAATEIDIERARAAEERARQRIRLHQSDVDLARAEYALRRALARIRTIEKTRAL
ncbi:MAG: F0F1 ATP synthase subunit epsilon [Armatimonadetes bacterium]|nr:F0F1 ATP synthase subunit epsilon [Armatimonadota bacterium]